MDVRLWQQAVVVLTVTMFCVPRMDLACQIALDATCTVYMEENGRKEIDIKRYAKVEKVGASGNLTQCPLMPKWPTALGILSKGRQLRTACIHTKQNKSYKIKEYSHSFRR